MLFWPPLAVEMVCLFSLADPMASELRDPFAHCAKENNTLGGVNIEPIRTKNVQNMRQVSEGTLTISNAIQRPSKVDIVCIYNQVVVQPCMGVSLKKFLHDEIYLEGPKDWCINGFLFNPSRGFDGAYQ